MRSEATAYGPITLAASMGKRRPLGLERCRDVRHAPHVAERQGQDHRASRAGRAGGQPPRDAERHPGIGREVPAIEDLEAVGLGAGVELGRDCAGEVGAVGRVDGAEESSGASNNSPERPKSCPPPDNWIGTTLFIGSLHKPRHLRHAC